MDINIIKLSLFKLKIIITHGSSIFFNLYVGGFILRYINAG